MTENEAYVGKAIRDSGIPREEFFVTTKLALASLPSTNCRHVLIDFIIIICRNVCHGEVEQACDASLAELDIGYIDLYLMHWPQAGKTGATSWDDNGNVPITPCQVQPDI